MTIVCVDNTPIMLQSLKENARNAYPYADVQTFSAEDAALEYAETFGCDVLLCEINPPRLEGLFLAERILKINPRETGKVKRIMVKIIGINIFFIAGLSSF